MSRSTRALGLALACLALAPGAAGAQQAQPLPEAAALIQRYVEAIGGREAVLDVKVSRATGTFEMPAAGLSGDLVVVTRAPNTVASAVNIPGMGTIRSGFDGTVGWSMDPMMGPRLLEGAELDAAREQANSLASVRDPSLFQSVRTEERTEIGGEACYRVKLVWKSGRESSDCYSVDTGLLVATTGEQQTPMGRIQVTTQMRDYRDFGGVRMPSRIVQEMMGQQQVLTISGVETENVDTSVLEPPAEIQALIAAGQ